MQLQAQSSRFFTTQRPSLRAAPQLRSRGNGRGSSVVVQVIEPTVAEAVSQQATAFAIVLAAEAALSRSNVPEADPGRPNVPQVAAGVGGTLAAVALVGNGGGLIPTIGLVLGLGVSSFMMYYNIKRAMDLKYDDGDFPGPKAWPGGMGLISFFAVTVFLQALVADISTKV